MVLNSSLPRPLCRRNPIPPFEVGPRDCLIGAAFSAPILTVRLLPIGAVAWYDGWSSQAEVLVKKPLCLRGLVWLLFWPPKDILLNPEIRKGGSSRPIPMEGLEAVGVSVGVVEVAVSLRLCKRAPLVGTGGKLAAEGAGEGLQDLKSANDLALRRLLLSVLPNALLSPTSSNPTEAWPRSVENGGAS